MKFIDLEAQQKNIRQKIEKGIKVVLDHGKYIMGPEISELEEKLADYIGVKYCITCSSGTDALLMSLMAKNIGKGDAVVTTPFTYIATAEVISLVQATPVFVDVNPVTFNICPDKIEEVIHQTKTKGLNPKAIIAVDLFGLPARYRIIEKIAKKHNLFLIEDAAQGFGSSIRGKMSGSFGDVSATSFFPAKPLGCYGDGGAVFTNQDDLAKNIKSIRIHGAGIDKYNNVRLGINGRLDSIQAAILLAKLSIFDEEIILRYNVAKRYTDGISNLYTKPYIPSNYKSSWAQYSILISDFMDREELIKKLKEKNIPTMVYYELPLHLQKVFHSLGYKKGDFPIAEKISKRIISLPMHPYLDKKSQDIIIKQLNI